MISALDRCPAVTPATVPPPVPSSAPTCATLQCHLPVPSSATYMCPAVPPTCAHQRHPPVPTSATHLCPPTSAVHQCNHQCHPPVLPVSAQGLCQSVPRSDASQC
ncbi:unnamed protein product, partial [Staurois parvus]